MPLLIILLVYKQLKSGWFHIASVIMTSPVLYEVAWKWYITGTEKFWKLPVLTILLCRYLFWFLDKSSYALL